MPAVSRALQAALQRQPGKKRFIVGYHQQGAPVLPQQLFQGLAGWQVEVVFRLVQKQQLRRLLGVDLTGQRRLQALAAAEQRTGRSTRAAGRSSCARRVRSTDLPTARLRSSNSSSTDRSGDNAARCWSR